MNKSQIIFLIYIFVFPSLALPNTVLDDAVGVVIDPIGLKKGSKNVLKTAKTISDSLDRTMIQLGQLQSKTDLDIRNYLSEVDEIVSNVNSTIRDVEDRAERILLMLSDRAMNLEKLVHQDAINAIWRAQCAAEVVATDTLQRSLAEAINTIRMSEPSFNVFGLPAGKIEIKSVDIRDPDIAYRAIKKERLRQLSDHLKEDDDAYIIRSTYLNLARLSKLTQCHYIGQDSEVIFIKDYYEFERLSIPWNRVVHIDD